MYLYAVMSNTSRRYLLPIYSDLQRAIRLLAIPALSRAISRCLREKLKYWKNLCLC